MIPIVCIGETQEDLYNTFGKIRLKTQVVWTLNGLERGQIEKLILAYKPVRAIEQKGAGNPQYIQDMHEFIRSTIAEAYGEITAEKVRIIYGGSISPESSRILSRFKDIDGLFIGRFGLESGRFKDIVEAAL